jgi:hypothetical protein
VLLMVILLLFLGDGVSESVVDLGCFGAKSKDTSFTIISSNPKKKNMMLDAPSVSTKLSFTKAIDLLRHEIDLTTLNRDRRFSIDNIDWSNLFEIFLF